MSLRPKRQLLESPQASLNASTSPSIASTVLMASPSVRRSARRQDSPSVSYRDSLRSSVIRDTPVRQLGRRRSRSSSRSRIFGMDASDRSRLDRNSDSEMEEEGGEKTILSTYQQLFMSNLVPILISPHGKGVAASLLLLLMLVFTQWVVGQGMTSMVTWVMGPLSGLRMAIMSLPEMVIGSVGRKVEINEIDLLVRMMNSYEMKEVIESVSKERMWEIGKEVDRKIRNEVEMVNKEVENVRKMYLDNEIKRLAMREEELTLDKARKEGENDAEGMEAGQDVRQKLELLEIQVEQLKLGLLESTKQLRERMEVSELAEEMGIMKRVLEELSKERKGVSEFEQKLGMVQEEVNHLNDRNKGLSDLNEELETVKHQLEKVGGQDRSVETVKEVLSNMLADPLSTVYEKVGDQQRKEMDRLENMMIEVIVKLNQTEPKLANTITEKVDRMKHSLEEELVQLTESIHNNWSKFHVDNSVSLPQVSAILESQLSQFSADRTGQVDWASLSLGGFIISTPHTTTRPTPGQVLSLLGLSIWQVSYTPRQIIQPYSAAGQCWAFSGMSGQVVMQLGQVVKVTGVTIEHIRPSPDLSSAPRNIVVWDNEDNTSLINLTYSISTSSSSVQTFPIPNRTSLPISKLRIEVTSNWGHPEYTCLYRVRVHGIQNKEEEKVIKVTEQDSSKILM